MKRLFSNSGTVALLGGLLVCGGTGPVHAQSEGQFVIPPIRAEGGTEFAYWDLFEMPPPEANKQFNYHYGNPPALFDGAGGDDDGNPSNLLSPRALLFQTASERCFVTSSGALYDFAATTAFETRYLVPAGQDAAVTNVIFQTQTGGNRFDLNNIRLVFDRDGVPVSLAPQFKALDDPQSGAFAERLVSAFQWNLTGENVRDFRLVFSAPGASMPLWQAQLDVVRGVPFQQQLGYLLLNRVRPPTRFGRAGAIVKNVPGGAEDRFFLPGSTLTLTAEPAPGWVHTGWEFREAVSTETELPVTFGDSDLTCTALFAPEDYQSWRDLIFNHANELLELPPENTDDSFSGPDADPDGDGAANLLEYAFGGDPYTHDIGRMTPEAVVVREGNQDYAGITYRQGTAGEFIDVTYTVRTSRDLQTWDDDQTVPVSRTVQRDGTTLVTVRSATPLSAPSEQRLFFTVKIEQ